jgi:hypothetical protein
MTTATAQAAPNIGFIKYRLAKLDRSNGKVCVQAMIGASKVMVQYFKR